MSWYIARGKVYDAFKWTGGPDQTDDPVWLVELLENGRAVIHNSGTPDLYMMIDKFKAVPGDYIFKNMEHGHIYPCGAHFFERQFEEAEELPDGTFRPIAKPGDELGQPGAAA